MSLIKDPVGARRLPVNPVPLPVHTADEAADRLAVFLNRYPRIFVLTGAGLSTDSGIPD